MPQIVIKRMLYPLPDGIPLKEVNEGRSKVASDISWLSRCARNYCGQSLNMRTWAWSWAGWAGWRDNPASQDHVEMNFDRGVRDNPWDPNMQAQDVHVRNCGFGKETVVIYASLEIGWRNKAKTRSPDLQIEIM